jgi:hypothetical protein
VEPFQLTRQSVTFLALMAGVALVVALAAPFGSIALGAVALIAIGAVLTKAMMRTRQWWPLTAVEGTVALCGLVLVIGGLGVVGYSMVRLGTGEPLRMMVGWPHMDPSRVGVSTRSVSYSDTDTQQRLKDGLREAGIPFTVKMQDGKEFVGWPAEHNAAAEAINEKVREGPFRAGRNAHIPDPELHKQFVGWLEKKGIKHEVVRSDGKDYIVWDQGGGDAVREFMESRGAAECKGKVAAGKAESGRC